MCGRGGHLAGRLKERGYSVRCSDIVDRGYPLEIIDFLRYKGEWEGDIITNPPYKYAKEFAQKSLEILKPGRKLALFLKLTFLESQKRYILFQDYPLKAVYVYSDRMECGKNGKFDSQFSSAICYAWFVWEKGYKGKTTLEIIPPTKMNRKGLKRKKHLKEKESPKKKKRQI